MQVIIQGTVKELASHGLRVNGKAVTQQMISVLVRLGACEEIGQEEKEPGQKGPAAKIYRFGGKKTFSFSIDNKVQEDDKKNIKEESPNKEVPKQEESPSPLQALKTAVEAENREESSKVSLPELPAALQSMTENDVKAMIVGLQSLQALMGNTLAKH